MTQLLAQIMHGEGTIKLIYQTSGESAAEFDSRIKTWLFENAKGYHLPLALKFIPLPDDDSVEALRGTH